MFFNFSCPSNEAGKLIQSIPLVDNDGKETFEVHAFKFNDNNKIAVTCTVRYCPNTFESQCKVIIYMYLVVKGPFILLFKLFIYLPTCLFVFYISLRLSICLYVCMCVIHIAATSFS